MEFWAPKISKQRENLASLSGIESYMAGTFAGALEPLIRHCKGASRGKSLDAQLARKDPVNAVQIALNMNKRKLKEEVRLETAST